MSKLSQCANYMIQYVMYCAVLHIGLVLLCCPVFRPPDLVGGLRFYCDSFLFLLSFFFVSSTTLLSHRMELIHIRPHGRKLV